MSRSMYWLLAAMLALLPLSSCRTAPPSPISMDAAATLSGANPTMVHRAAQFRQYVVKHSGQTGVVIDAKSQLFYAKEFDRLAARCKMLGFSEVYIAIPDPQRLTKSFDDYPAQMRRLLSELHRAGLKCYASLDLNYLYHYQTDVSMNPFAGERVSNVLDPIKSFNSGWSVTPEQRFDGVEAFMLPNKVLPEVKSRTAPLYNWGEKQYGKNGENNILIQQTLSFMEKIRDSADKMTVIENIGYDFHDKTCEGQLGQASIGNFLDLCDFVIIDNTSNDPDEIIANISLELHKAVKKQSIAVRVISSQEFYSNEAAEKSFSRKPWASVVKELHKVCRESNKNPTFRGVVFDNFAGLEILWERTL